MIKWLFGAAVLIFILWALATQFDDLYQTTKLWIYGGILAVILFLLFKGSGGGGRGGPLGGGPPTNVEGLGS